MDVSEYVQQLAKAQIASYAALVNTMKGVDGFDLSALTSRLQQYSHFFPAQDAGAAQFLQALAGSLSADETQVSEILQKLH